ncbi:MAG: threonine ammonia-lyase [Desulfobulbaceae bacterium]|nr:threonine ammonia-lyase [Desulfobulbaceae bacterium]
MEITLQDILKAAAAITGGVVQTPCLFSRVLSRICGAEVFVKFENLQFTGSFKDRGALNCLLGLDENARRRGVAAASAGNHAQAVAYHAQRLGIPAVVVMPVHTPTFKVEHTRSFGAEVLLEGEGLEEAVRAALRLAEQRGLFLVHPYDDPLVIAGQGTVALEMLDACGELDALFVPVGGGGLLAGNAVAARARRPGIKIFGVQTELYPGMADALAGRSPRFGSFSIAEGIAVKKPGALTLPIIRQLADGILVVSEEEIEKAVLLLLEVEKTVAEGAGAASLATLMVNAGRFQGRKVGVVLSGGNIDMPVLASIIQRGLVRSQRLVRLIVEIRDIPGSLAEVTKIIAAAGGNIVRVDHHRTFSSLPVQHAEVEFTLRTRGPDHAAGIRAALAQTGFPVRDACP